jgi:hypothetical protein
MLVDTNINRKKSLVDPQSNDHLVSSALLLIGGAHIDARVLLDI